jgi:hypothetical protein
MKTKNKTQVQKSQAAKISTALLLLNFLIGNTAFGRESELAGHIPAPVDQLDQPQRPSSVGNLAFDCVGASGPIKLVKFNLILLPAEDGNSGPEPILFGRVLSRAADAPDKLIVYLARPLILQDPNTPAANSAETAPAAASETAIAASTGKSAPTDAPVDLQTVPRLSVGVNSESRGTVIGHTTGFPGVVSSADDLHFPIAIGFGENPAAIENFSVLSCSPAKKNFSI